VSSSQSKDQPNCSFTIGQEEILEGSFAFVTAQAFQDIPFSLPYTFQALDMRFPGSKFILTIRNNPDQWYHSLISFHSKLFGRGKVPDYDDLKKATYVYPDWILEAN